MLLSNELLKAFGETIEECNSTAYDEPISTLHTELTTDRWRHFKEVTGIQPPARIIDIGCGSGFAMDMFRNEGFDVSGMTTRPQEVEEVNRRGHCVFPWDMHEIARFSNYFHAAWVRHSLEHSFAPFLMLRMIKTALVPGGFCYIEVPGAGTSSQHEWNVNHWSILSKSAWELLIARAGFEFMEPPEVIRFNTGLGQDEYYSWILKSVSA